MLKQTNGLSVIQTFLCCWQLPVVSVSTVIWDTKQAADLKPDFLWKGSSKKKDPFQRKSCSYLPNLICHCNIMSTISGLSAAGKAEGSGKTGFGPAWLPSLSESFPAFAWNWQASHAAAQECSAQQRNWMPDGPETQAPEVWAPQREECQTADRWVSPEALSHNRWTSSRGFFCGDKLDDDSQKMLFGEEARGLGTSSSMMRNRKNKRGMQRMQSFYLLVQPRLPWTLPLWLPNFEDWPEDLLQSHLSLNWHLFFQPRLSTFFWNYGSFNQLLFVVLHSIP